MKEDLMGKMNAFLDILGISEEPMGIYYTDVKPPTWDIVRKKIFRSKKMWGE